MNENKVWLFGLFVKHDRDETGQLVGVKVVAKDAVSAALEVGRQFPDHNYEVQILEYEGIPF